MEKFKRFVNIDYAKYQKDCDLEVYYGLPEDVAFCSKCVISNQRPNSCEEYKNGKKSIKETIRLDSQRVCDACKTAVRKEEIDWNEREQELIELCEKHRSKDGSYDCLVPGSGGKDSFYQAHMLKYKYGMHPLTITWAPNMYTEWGWKNQRAWVNAGFDNILYTPNGKVHRLLTRLAVENLFYPFQPFILGQKALAPKVAAMYHIPLIFYGENEAEYGNPIQDNTNATRDWKYFTAEDKNKILIAGTSIADLTEYFGVEPGELRFYMPTDPGIIEQEHIEVHYLGYYLKWHPQGAYYYAVENGGFQASPERTAGTYSKYNSIDDKIDDFHYYTTYIKFGIGRATYDAAQEIRNGEITREEGMALVEKFDGEFPERFANEIFEYLSIRPSEYQVASQMFEQPEMDKEYFMHLADRFRSPHLWKYENGDWKLREQGFHERWK